MKQHLSNFDSAPLTCDPTVSSGKIIPNIAKSDRIFPGKGREDKDFILTCMDSSMAEVFPHCCLFFSILTIFRKKRELKVGSEVLTFFFSYFIQSRVFYPQLTLRQLIQPDLESRFIVRSQLDPSIQSGFSPSVGLQVVTQSTNLSIDCYPQQVSNSYRSKIRLPKQPDYKCMPLHPALDPPLFHEQSNPSKIFQIVILIARVYLQ